MKKLLCLLFLIPFGFLASCSDEDDFPSVDITMTIDNAVLDGDHLYIVDGEPLTVQSIDVAGLGGNAAAISRVSYQLDYVGIYYTIVAPFGAEIPAAYLPAGNHLLGVNFAVLQVDKSIAYASIQNVVTVVPTVEDLPNGATPGTVELKYRLNPKQ